MIRIAGLLALLIAGATAAQATEVRAWLDRDTLEQGETVTLNVEAKGGGGNARPDFTALAQDFELLGTQSSQQLSIVNGQRSASTLWAVGLQPRRVGRITIAPIQVGDSQTAPIELEVRAASAASRPQAGDDVFLEVAAEPLDPYVQQQVRYTVKLYYAFDLTNGNLAEPSAEGLAVQRLGQDKTYFATLGARRYHVVERHYALTPERSGEVTIEALAFRGSALDSSDPTGFFSRGRSVAARSEPVRLDVRPKPAAWTDGAWLPAASILLEDQGELPTEVRVGDPVTRTIRLQAQGLGYEQLPEFDLAAPAGADVYPDKADTRTRDDGEWLYGERVRKFAFVPDRPGTITVPGLAIRWWDTVHDRMQTSELPARQVTVLPALATPAPDAAVAAAPAGAPRGNGYIALTTPGGHATDWRTLAIVAFSLWLLT
ncbi:MAG TPA: BatD family protein, partial [Dokdonella sp.]